MSQEPCIKQMASSAVYNAVQNALQEIVASTATAACKSIERIYRDALFESLEDMGEASMQQAEATAQDRIDVQKVAYAAAKQVFREIERMEQKS
jgi:gluconate kinase